MKRQDLLTALGRLPISHLHQRRDDLLEELQRQGWPWPSELNARLDQVDDALTELGVFGTRAHA